MRDFCRSWTVGRKGIDENGPLESAGLKNLPRRERIKPDGEAPDPFDFETDATLVCSELVYKAYEAGPECQGVVFPVSEIMGRKVCTPNEMVRQFDMQYGTRHAQADFVIFLDGIEKERRALESTPAHFRTSWHRPNWHILVQEVPTASR